MLLHQAARGVLSAAVRLGLIGPHEAQRVHHEATAALERALARVVPVSEVASTAPLLDLLQGAHDRLYARLFQS
jgi:urease accessory protein